jgi:glutathione synthase
MLRPMRFLFVMDPYATMLPDKDTSFAFMRAARSRGHSCFHTLVQHVSNEGKTVRALARRVEVQDTEPFVQAGQPEWLEVEAIDAVFVRKDPPFDSAYLHLTQQLDLLPERVLVINGSAGLRNANEKLFAFHFAEFMPKSLVTSNTDRMLEFIVAVGGQAVVKPLDGAGGSGVMGVEIGSRNTRGILDYATGEGQRLALVQEFRPEVVAGDKRVLLLDGELLGAIRRVPRPDDIRANIHVGGRVEACELTTAERELVSALGPRLRAERLYFVGLDLIAEKLIEINVTSPTGIQELGRLTGTHPEQEVIAWVERRVTAG